MTAGHSRITIVSDTVGVFVRTPALICAAVAARTHQKQRGRHAHHDPDPLEKTVRVTAVSNTTPCSVWVRTSPMAMYAHVKPVKTSVSEGAVMMRNRSAGVP